MWVARGFGRCFGMGLIWVGPFRTTWAARGVHIGTMWAGRYVHYMIPKWEPNGLAYMCTAWVTDGLKRGCLHVYCMGIMWVHSGLDIVCHMGP